MTRGSFLPGGGQGWAGAQDGPRTPLLRFWALRVPHCYGNCGRLAAPAGFKDERTKSSSWLPRWLSGQRLCNAGGTGWPSGSGISPRGGSANPLQYSCLENPRDRGAWQVTDHRVVKTGLSDYAQNHKLSLRCLGHTRATA